MRVAVLIPGARKGRQPIKFAAFLEALAAQMGEVVVWDVALRRIDQVLIGLRTFNSDRARFRGRFNASPEAFRRRTHAVERLVAADPGHIDVVLQMGMTFDAKAAAARWPVVIYTDYSVVLTRDHGREWRLDLTEAQVGERVRLERQALSRATRICARSAFVADALNRVQRVPPERLSVVGAGPNIRATGEKAEPVRLLFFGNDFPRKGGDLVLESFARLRAEFPWAEIDIVAPAPMHQDLPGVTWHPDVRIEMVASLLGRASILLMPSRFETWGNVLIEAMAAGIVPVISNLSPMTEIITDGVEGLIVPKDDVEALTAATRSLLTDPLLRDRCARAAALRATRDFSQAAVATRVARALRQAMALRR
jgi:glycosyltransferase involved in cell wall biosynthesis